MSTGRESATAAQLRSEVVEILAAAIVRLLLEARVPPLRDDKQVHGERR